MAADDAAVTVSLRADLKGYEAALKSAVRATEKAAKAAETAISGVGKGAKPNFSAINDNFQKSAGQIANDARIMQFQLNDIFSGLASGQGIRAVQQQLGQIAQQLSGGGLTAGARTMGAALAGMINPINLAVVAFGFAASAAVSYFSDSEEGAEKTNAAIKEQAALLRKVADAWGDQLPGIRAVADELDRIAEINDAVAGTAALVAKAYKPAIDAVDELALQAAETALKLSDALPIEEVSKITQKWDELVRKIREHKASAAEVKELQDLLLATGIAGAIELARNLDGVRAMMDTISASARKAETDLRSALAWSQEFQGPPIPGQPQLPRTIEARPERRVDPYFDDPQAAGKKSGDAYVEGLRRSFVGGRSDLEGLNRDFGERLLQMITDAQRQAGKISIFSAHRDLERQAELYWNKVDSLMKQGMSKVSAQQAARKWVAFPSPEAPHVKGIAADLRFDSDAVKQWAHDNAEAYGLVFRMSHEGWHIELADQSKVREGRQRTVADLVANTQAEIALKQQINAINANSALTEDQRTMAIARATSEAERAALVERLLNEARAEGLEITPALTAQYEALAAQMQATSLRGTELATSMRKSGDTAGSLKNLTDTLGQLTSQAIVGFVQDLRSGTDAAEALYNQLSRIADQLLSMALNFAIQNLFKSLTGGLGGGIPMPGMASGGYTGDIAKNRPAGFVHGQEFVVNAAATQKHRQLLESINKGLPGYASGGFVLPRMTGFSSVAPSQQAPQVHTRVPVSVINTFDAGSFLSEALSKPAGVNVVLNMMRAQPGAFRSAIQG